MEFSEIDRAAVEHSLESDLAHARWYQKLPDERKTEFIAEGYEFALDMARARALARNPFSTESNAVFELILASQKGETEAEMLEFIEKKMAERSEREWQTRFREMKKTLGWSYDDMARFVGAASGKSVKSSVGRQLPAFAKLAVCVFETMKKQEKQEKPA